MVKGNSVVSEAELLLLLLVCLEKVKNVSKQRRLVMEAELLYCFLFLQHLAFGLLLFTCSG